MTEKNKLRTKEEILREFDEKFRDYHIDNEITKEVLSPFVTIEALKQFLSEVIDELEKYHSELTEEKLRKKDGFLHLGTGCSVVTTEYLKQLEQTKPLSEEISEYKIAHIIAGTDCKVAGGYTAKHLGQAKDIKDYVCSKFSQPQTDKYHRHHEIHEGNCVTCYMLAQPQTVDWEGLEAFIHDRLAEMLRERGTQDCWGDKSFDIAEIYLPTIIACIKDEWLKTGKEVSVEEIKKFAIEGEQKALFYDGLDGRMESIAKAIHERIMGKDGG